MRFKSKQSLVLLGLIVIPAIVAIWWWQRPLNVATTALESFGSARTQKFDAHLTIGNANTTTSLVGGPAQVSLNLTGQYEIMADSLDSLSSGVELIITSEGLTLTIEADVIFIGDSLYLRITKSPQAFPLLAQLKGQWIELPRGGKDSDQITPTSAPLISTITRDGTEEVAGATTNVYLAQATSDAVIAFLNSTVDILGSRLTTDQVNELRQGIAATDAVPVKLWITPITHELKKLTADLDTPDGSLFNLTILPTQRNEPVDISAPQGAVTLEQLQGSQ